MIDDSHTARQQVMSTLGGVGYDVVEAVDGLDGLRKLDEHRDASLVLCDLNMPAMNGLEVLTRLGAERPTDRPIVLMFTTEMELDLIQQAKQAGAKGWIVKPFKPDLLIAAVRRLVGEA